MTKTEKQECSIEKQKELMLGILCEIDQFCTDNGIKYCLAYGTLLGAVRHKGFIPWDDDIDIVMDRDNYELFVKTFNNTGNLRLITIDNTPGYYLLTAKVCDMRTILIEDVNNPIEIGVYVDIFVNDYLTDDINVAKRIVKENKLLYKTILPSMIAYREGRSFSKRVLLKLLQTITGVVKREKVLKKIEKVSRKYEYKNDSKYCGSVMSLYYGYKEIMESNWWEKIQKMPFEGYAFNVPVQYDYILRHLYGDYMQLPPIENRVTHHSHKVYWR